jgi:pyruvate,water dikinase
MASAFVAPGPGEWAIDRTHYPNGATPISQWLLREGFHRGFTRVFAELGMPAERIDLAFINGFMYTRLRPLIGADKPSRKSPPAFAVKIASRLHPAFRERNRTAKATLRDRPSNRIVDRWENELRPRLRELNKSFQKFDPDAASDEALQQHIIDLLDQLRENFELHFWLHGHDLGPIARYLHSCIGWRLDPTEAVSALAGASPSTARPQQTLRRLRHLIEEAEAKVTSLDDIREISPEARETLDGYLRDHGHVLTAGYDIDSTTLIERPTMILDSIRSSAEPPRHNADGIAGRLRSQVPPDQRANFDMFLADARNVMDMRDDNGPLTIEWPVGLLRRALLAAGRRLAHRGSLGEPAHALELTHQEARRLFDGSLPPADEIAQRADERVAQAHLTAPETLGRPEPEPPLSALPPALGQLTAMTQVAMKYMGMDGSTSSDGFGGAGIGTQPYVGTARVADSADDAFDRLEPGDVLIVRATSPAFNAVLAIAGAVVTANGGVLSHAAVLSRELGIPAVIGATSALSIADGSTVEVDPAAGRVRVISS